MPNGKWTVYKNHETGLLFDITDADAQGKLTAILDGTNIDSFGDVETALATKVDKVTGKGLSTNDYDNTEKAKVAGAFPRSEQAVLGAVNILDNKAPTATENGITYTVNADKSETISGTATAESRTRIWPNLGSFLDPYKGKTLYLSAGLPSNAPDDYFLNLVQKQGNIDLSSVNVVGGEISFTVDSRTDNLYIAFIVKNGTNLSTPITIKPQITLAPNTPYVPYAMTNKELTDIVQKIKDIDISLSNESHKMYEENGITILSASFNYNDDLYTSVHANESPTLGIRDTRVYLETATNTTRTFKVRIRYV